MSQLAKPYGVISAATPPARVFVRDRSRTAGALALGAMGTRTHQATLGTMVLNVTVLLDGGVTLDCPPHWVRDAADLPGLLGLPA